MSAAFMLIQPRDLCSQQHELVRHVETTLARSLYNCDELAAYSGTALAFRDRLIIEWNKTQQRQTLNDQKRVYCNTEWLTLWILR
jgi:starch phosphorylase